MAKSKSSKIKLRKVRVVNPAVDPERACCLPCALEGRNLRQSNQATRTRRSPFLSKEEQDLLIEMYQWEDDEYDEPMDLTEGQRSEAATLELAGFVNYDDDSGTATLTRHGYDKGKSLWRRNQARIFNVARRLANGGTR